MRLMMMGSCRVKVRIKKRITDKYIAASCLCVSLQAQAPDFHSAGHFQTPDHCILVTAENNNDSS